MFLLARERLNHVTLSGHSLLVILACHLRKNPAADHLDWELLLALANHANQYRESDNALSPPMPRSSLPHNSPCSASTRPSGLSSSMKNPRPTSPAFQLSPGCLSRPLPSVPPQPRQRASFFRQPQRGPQSTPARDRVRDLAVAMRKRNLSVYDIQRELAASGHSIAINTLTVLLREEGFSRLPRRADDERPPTVKPDIAQVADVRRLDLSPRVFRTPLGGLFLFLPVMDGSICRGGQAGPVAGLGDDSRRPGGPRVSWP